MVDLEDMADRAMEYIVELEYLASLSNPHVLEVPLMWNDQITQFFMTAQKEWKMKVQLEQVRTLVLPHGASDGCSNAGDLMCCYMETDRGFTEPLVAGGLNHVTKFSISYRDGKNLRSIRGILSSRLDFVSRPPSV